MVDIAPLFVAQILLSRMIQQYSNQWTAEGREMKLSCPYVWYELSDNHESPQ